jgi:hypothetical protein
MDSTGGTLDMSSLTGDYSVHWYDPRNGGSLLSGSVSTVIAGSSGVSYGEPPNAPDMDWAILLEKMAGAAAAAAAAAEAAEEEEEECTGFLRRCDSDKDCCSKRCLFGRRCLWDPLFFTEIEAFYE